MIFCFKVNNLLNIWRGFEIRDRYKTIAQLANPRDCFLGF